MQNNVVLNSSKSRMISISNTKYSNASQLCICHRYRVSNSFQFSYFDVELKVLICSNKRYSDIRQHNFSALSLLNFVARKDCRLFKYRNIIILFWNKKLYPTSLGLLVVFFYLGQISFGISIQMYWIRVYFIFKKISKHILYEKFKSVYDILKIFIICSKK